MLTYKIVENNNCFTFESNVKYMTVVHQIYMNGFTKCMILAQIHSFLHIYFKPFCAQSRRDMWQPWAIIFFFLTVRNFATYV